MYVKRNASKPPPEPSKEKKNLPKFEVVSKSTVLWKGPNISTHFASMISIPLLIFLLYYMLKTPPRCCGSFAQFKRNFSFPKKFCVLQIQSFEIWKKQYCIHYSSTFDILYYVYVFVCSMFARKEVLFSGMYTKTIMIFENLQPNYSLALDGTGQTKNVIACLFSR